MRRDNKQVSDPFRQNANGADISNDDVSMLNIVLQRVKGINSVSGRMSEIMAPSYDAGDG